jgi:hypothetical protein
VTILKEARVVSRRRVGLEAARRFKEILRQGSSSTARLPPLLPPPNLEERRPLKISRRGDPEQDE